MGHVTQDRSIDAENSALIRNQLHFKIYSNRKQLLYIVQLYFGSNQCRLGEQRKLLKKKKNITNLTLQKLLIGYIHYRNVIL